MTDRQTAALVRQGRWVRVFRGVFDVGAFPGSPHHDRYDRARRRQAIIGVLGRPGSGATGVSALVLHGVQGAPIDVVPEVTFPDGSPRSGPRPARVRRTPVRRWHLVDGLPCVSVEEALGRAVPELDRRHAVALMDSARRRRSMTEDAFNRAREVSRGRRGAARSGPWWDESDPRAESPAETWARLSCVDHDVAPDALQLVVLREGAFVARVDLAWLLPGGGVLLVEIDGREVHSTLDAVVGDRHRQNRLSGRRTILLRFSGKDAWNGRVGQDVSEVLRQFDWSPRPTTGPFELST
jgi:hypothetical protein